MYSVERNGNCAGDAIRLYNDNPSRKTLPKLILFSLSTALHLVEFRVELIKRIQR